MTAGAEAASSPDEPQRQRLHRDPVLAKGTFVMKVPFGRGGAQWRFQSIDDLAVQVGAVQADSFLRVRAFAGLLAL